MFTTHTEEKLHNYTTNNLYMIWISHFSVKQIYS